MKAESYAESISFSNETIGFLSMRLEEEKKINSFLSELTGQAR
jgi:hypothetical protein